MDWTTNLAGCLDRLSTALTRLDQDTMDECLSELDGLRQHLPPEALSSVDAAVLMFRLHHAAALADNASALYEGYARLAMPPATAYTAKGTKSGVSTGGSMAVEA